MNWRARFARQDWCLAWEGNRRSHAGQVRLVGGLDYGGRAVLQHATLRWMLARNGSLPFRDRDLIAFLDYCVERIFLRRVGGGWIFVHRLLMEHFASLDTERDEATRPVA